MNNSEKKNHKELRQSDVGVWLLMVAVLVFLIIIVGGATRLTNSGLSITHWSPIHGVVPPINQSDWVQEFAQYQKYAEYKFENHGMSLEEFKFIFWWEWAHRILGRVIGLALLLPLIVFTFMRKLKQRDIAPLASVVILVGLQGLIGWWMVSSGLDGKRVDVAAYRLAGHLGMGFVLLGLLVTMAHKRLFPTHCSTDKKGVWNWVLILAFLQIIFGAFTAGTHAGFIHNDWPTIDGNLLPDQYFELSPIFSNFVENTQNIQFNHRIIAYCLFAVLLICAFKSRNNTNKIHILFANISVLLVICQIILGVTLLYVFSRFTPPMPIGVLFGVAHQGLAAILFAIIVLARQTYSQRKTG